MNENTELLTVKGINQNYGDNVKKFIAVQDVNLNISRGQFVALLGPSGCGKSTLLRILTGLQKPSEGEVLYKGKLLTGVNPHSTIVFQSFALFPWLTVLENVEVALKVKGVPPKLRTQRALDSLDRVGLDGFEMAYPRELSGGMRQKVGFARAMVVEPELLCLDEPFSALDVLSAESLRNELLELWTSGKIPTKAILMVTHNIEEAVLLADRIIIMDKNPGRIISEIHVPLPHFRERNSHEFQLIVDQVYATLAGQTKTEQEEMGTAPGEPGITRRLPHISITNLTGMLEFLNDTKLKKMDIFKLADDIGVDSDHLLLLTEASELLGFAIISSGDITLTSLGETFADASISAKKEIFATRIKRLPVFKWLITLLSLADDQKLSRDLVLTPLELEFPSEEAEKQFDTLANWARYAELLVYDDNEEVIYLEPGSNVHQ
ncbi:MAG: nitrate ABC transporter ATP-binding protein [Chlorobiaceae bacterium]|nr:nitrate ABC transporter ATP-binding protein [Chlorobiaceae bacterium]MBA4309741.1 nitrate ABC transporter ATP-binding protein [Chlorobiaceae bacterium]